MKNICFSIVLLLCCQYSRAQELSIDFSIFTYQNEPRPSTFDYSTYGAMGHMGFYYGDTLAKKWDYKIGLAFAGSTIESYYSQVEVQGVGINNDTVFYTRNIGDYYQTRNLALNLGVIYWPREKRKGLYFPAELITTFFIDGNLRETRLGDDGRPHATYLDSDDSYVKLNLQLRTGIGYKLIVYKGLSISAAYNLLFRIGNVIKGVDDSFAFNRGLTLSGGYKF